MSKNNKKNNGKELIYKEKIIMRVVGLYCTLKSFKVIDVCYFYSKDRNPLIFFFPQTNFFLILSFYPFLILGNCFALLLRDHLGKTA